MTGMNRWLGLALGLCLFGGAELAYAQVLSDRLQIVDAATGVVAFEAFIDERTETPIVTPILIGFFANGAVILTEPGLENAKISDVIFPFTPSTLSFSSDTEGPPVLDPPPGPLTFITETGGLQDITDGLVRVNLPPFPPSSPFRILVQSDVERVPEPGTLVLIVAGLLGLLAGEAVRQTALKPTAQAPMAAGSGTSISSQVEPLERPRWIPTVVELFLFRPQCVAVKRALRHRVER